MTLASASWVGAALLGLAAPACWAQADASLHGRWVFEHYCSRCHGANADGQSELAKLLTPKPANLRTTRLDTAQLTDIITAGGAARGRSPSMPAWGEQLSSLDVTSVVEYLHTLRAP